jgi:hypothetical protein
LTQGSDHIDFDMMTQIFRCDIICVAWIRILAVETEMASGEIINRTEEVSIGDRVDKKR